MASGPASSRRAASSNRASYRVRLSPAAVLDAFRQLPKLQGERPDFTLTERRDGCVIRRTRRKPPYEDYEVAPLELRVTLQAEGEDVLVRIRTRAAPRWSGISVAFGWALVNAGGNLLGDLWNIRGIRRRRLRDRRELLNLAAQALARHEIGGHEGPYRTRDDP